MKSTAKNLSVDHQLKSLTPREIVAELDRYIVGQEKAKRAVSIALRNRWRRQQVPDELRDEIAPKNIIMMGPTGVGKTEIARRLAKLSDAPFIKVEASKFTEVGYVGKDVESMVRDLVELSFKMIKEAEMARVQPRAAEAAEERLLDLLIPRKKREAAETISLVQDEEEVRSTREKLRAMLHQGVMNDRTVELDVASNPMQLVEIISSPGLEEMGMNLRDMFSQVMPRGHKRRRVKVDEALKILTAEEAAKLIDGEQVTRLAIARAEQHGIIFIDEIDKVAGRERGHGPEVSREGVQRDLLPIVEGSSVNTKYGVVRTDHMLFIASGAFHVSKPSDLIPELQGRFPIRVELNPLTQSDFVRILTEPTNSLTRQYVALMNTEGIDIAFTRDGVEALAQYSALVNERTENIGARRLHTIMERVLDDISFEAPERRGEKVIIDSGYVKTRLAEVVKDVDLSRYIL